MENDSSALGLGGVREVQKFCQLSTLAAFSVFCHSTDLPLAVLLKPLQSLGARGVFQSKPLLGCRERTPRFKSGPGTWQQWGKKGHCEPEQGGGGDNKGHPPHSTGAELCIGGSGDS